MLGAALAVVWIGGSTRPKKHRTRSAEPAQSLLAAAPRTRLPRSTLDSTRKSQAARLSRLGFPVFCAGHRGHAIALTFDDGPGLYTDLALRILRRDHARATFFLVGRLLTDWPTLPARERALGSLGDHTWSHPNLAALPPMAIAGQLEDTRRAIAAHAHVRVDLFRPPYGLRNAAVDRVARQLGMLEVLWNVDSFDWAGADAKGIARNVLNHVSPGAIVLMHENRGQTIKALKFILLPALRRLRYRLVTVPELLAADPPTAAQLHRGLSGCSNNSASPGVLRFGSATVRSSRAQP